MLIKTESKVSLANNFMVYDKSDTSDENYEEEGELEIDLDYNEFVDVTIKEEDEPLDLSMKSVIRTCDIVASAPKLPQIDIKPNFKLLEPEQRVGESESKGTVMTELEVTRLLEPYVKSVHKKFTCAVCDMKFVSKQKALTHVENKHVDCLQYKCPLCRASKVTRLAYESHLRRGHNARVRDHTPGIRCKKRFCVKSEAQSSQAESKVGRQYDFQFVTFLRHILSPASPGTGNNNNNNNNTNNNNSAATQNQNYSCAEWLEQEQAIFRIHNPDQFARAWYAFKVSWNRAPSGSLVFWLVLNIAFQGTEIGSWNSLYNSVISEFVNRNIFKQLSSDDLVFQVFCIKQLLK